MVYVVTVAAVCRDHRSATTTLGRKASGWRPGQRVNESRRDVRGTMTRGHQEHDLERSAVAQRSGRGGMLTRYAQLTKERARVTTTKGLSLVVASVWNKGR